MNYKLKIQSQSLHRLSKGIIKEIYDLNSSLIYLDFKRFIKIRLYSCNKKIPKIPKPKKFLCHQDAFDLASLSKPILATMILKILDQKPKKFHLQTKIYQILPEFIKFPSLSISDFLMHKTGLDLIQKFSKNKYYSSKDISELLFKINNLEFNPNKILYSDLNYLWLGRLLEKISGLSLEQNLINLNHAINTDFRYWTDLKKLNQKDRLKIHTSQINLSSCLVNDPKAGWIKTPTGHAGIFGKIKDLENFCISWLFNSFNFSEKIYQEATNLNSNSFLKNPIYGLVWRSGLLTKSPNHSGFTGTSIGINFYQKKVLIIKSPNTFPRPSLRRRLKFRKLCQKLFSTFNF